MTRARITRVESWATQGFPDCLLALGGRFLLVELKVVEKGNRVAISPHQIAFHEAHKALPCYLMVLHGLRKDQRVRLYKAGQVMSIAENGMAEVEPVLSCEPSAEGWTMLEDELMKT